MKDKSTHISKEKILFLLYLFLIAQQNRIVFTLEGHSNYRTWNDFWKIVTVLRFNFLCKILAIFLSNLRQNVFFYIVLLSSYLRKLLLVWLHERFSLRFFTPLRRTGENMGEWIRKLPQYEPFWFTLAQASNSDHK